jgi:hypothetical protein
VSPTDEETEVDRTWLRMLVQTRLVSSRHCWLEDLSGHLPLLYSPCWQPMCLPCCLRREEAVPGSPWHLPGAGVAQFVLNRTWWNGWGWWAVLTMTYPQS